jgi:hypothetical protein
MAPLYGRIIDAWMQYPTARFRAQPIFDPLRRWFPTANLAADDEIPPAATIGNGCRRCLSRARVRVVGTSRT